MNCPECGAANRQGAQFCDSCGHPLAAGLSSPSEVDDLPAEMPDEEPLLGSGGLGGWLVLDWFLRFVIVAVVCFLGGAWALSQGAYDYGVGLTILGLVGALGAFFVSKAKR